MQPLLAIAWLTWKAAFRFRLFLVVAVLLLGCVVGLPLLIKDDGTARGFTQILLTYTLSTITALLGLSIKTALDYIYITIVNFRLGFVKQLIYP